MLPGTGSFPKCVQQLWLEAKTGKLGMQSISPMEVAWSQVVEPSLVPPRCWNHHRARTWTGCPDAGYRQPKQFFTTRPAAFAENSLLPSKAKHTVCHVIALLITQLDLKQKNSLHISLSTLFHSWFLELKKHFLSSSHLSAFRLVLAVYNVRGMKMFSVFAPLFSKWIK